MSRGWLDLWIEHLGGLLGCVDAEQNERGPILHDQDSGEHQGRDVDKLAFDGFGFQAGPSRRAVIERHREPSVQNWQSAQQRLTADRTAVVARQISERGGEGVIPRHPDVARFRGFWGWLFRGSSVFAGNQTGFTK